MDQNEQPVKKSFQIHWHRPTGRNVLPIKTGNLTKKIGQTGYSMVDTIDDVIPYLSRARVSAGPGDAPITIVPSKIGKAIGELLGGAAIGA